jgi:hypothetical protein
MADNSKLSKPGLIPLKVENQGSLITTQINKINFSGSGVTASVGQFNDITISVNGGGGSGVSSSYALTASYAETASYFSGSINNAISASYAADFNKTGLITTGSFGTTQIISGSLTLGNTTSTTNDNITITGTSAGGGVAFISASKFLKIGATLDLTLESPSGIYTNAPYVLVGDSTGGTTDVEIYGSTAITAQTPLFTVNADSTVMNGA